MTYRLKKNGQDPEITLQMSPSLVQDLVKRSQENGRDINLEIAMRLARSLENEKVYPNDNDVIAILKNPKKKSKKG